MTKEDRLMKYRQRKELLESRAGVNNRKIVAKLNRKIRALEQSEEK